MSDVELPVADAPPARGVDGRWWTPRRAAIGVALALLLLFAGYEVGVRSPWTAHHPTVVSGTAQRVPADVPTGYFDSVDGHRVAFRLDEVVWKANGTTEVGSIAPCLRENGKRVPVEAGVIEVTRPYGSGSYQVVLSLTCP